MTLPVAILAGGLATRLGDVSRATPKSLVDVGGRPFAVRQLELLRRAGVDDVVFCLGHLGEQVQAAIGDGPASLWVYRDNPRASAFYVHHDFIPDGDERVDSEGILEIRMVRR